MFGMLDYRAHKLYWLLSLPFRILSWVLLIIIFFASCNIASSYVDNLFFQFLLAFLLMQLFSVSLYVLIRFIIDPIFNIIFFFLIDVIPCEERTDEQARQIVLLGENFSIVQKPILKWTSKDTQKIINSSWFNKKFLSVTIVCRHALLAQKAREILEESGEEVYWYDYRIQDFSEKREEFKSAVIEKIWTDKFIRSLIISYSIFVLVFFVSSPNGTFSSPKDDFSDIEAILNESDKK